MNIFGRVTRSPNEGIDETGGLPRCKNCGHAEAHNGVVGDCRFMILTYREWVKCPCPAFVADDSAEALAHQELDEVIHAVRQAAIGSYPKVHSLAWLAGWLMIKGSDKLLLKPLYNIYRAAIWREKRERN